MPKDKPTLTLYLKEHERCAFGRGWESKRRGETMTSNPFGRNSWQWEAWRDGWLNFKVSEAYL